MYIMYVATGILLSPRNQRIERLQAMVRPEPIFGP